MTETTTADTKGKTTKHAASSFDMPDYGIPKFSLPNMEMPEAFREIAEKGIAHARDTYGKAKVASFAAFDQQGVERMTRRLGIKASFHATRHHHASRLIADGIDVVTVSRRLGHGSPAITLKIYAHLLEPDDRAAKVMQRARTEPL